MTIRFDLLLATLLIAGVPQGLVAAGGHAEEDELALAAAQLAASSGEASPQVQASAVPSDPAALSSNGEWSSVIYWTPHIPVSAANLPDGRLLTFASNQRTSFPVGAEFTYAATWDPATGVFQEFNHPSHDMFCGGITVMTDGRVMVNGGRNEVTSTSVFDWRTNTWTRLQNMNGGRWYNTTVSMPNGHVFTATGNGTGQFTTERWNTAGWTLLTGIGWEYVTGLDAGYMKHWHPFVSVAPDGRLLHFGPTDTMHWFNAAGTGSFANTGTAVPGSHYPKEGSWVMYDEGKVLVAGGSINTTERPDDGTLGTSTNLAYTVDMTTSPPTITPAAPMQYARQMANAVVMPNGEVLVTGGNAPGQKFSDVGSVLPCEIWNPGTGTWRTVAAISVPRNYHSVALLLPDGRVWSAGGGLGGGDHQDAQVFSPPGLFTTGGASATRPVLASAPSVIASGARFTVTGTAGLVKFALIRMAAVTHSVNTDQRYLSLPFTETSAGNYQITAHSNLNVMTPGYWMLFGIDANGAFSTSKIIQVDPNSTIVMTNPGAQSRIVGASVSLPISATAPGGTTLAYTASGLPPGLSIHPSTGLITGAPLTDGIFTSRITATGGGFAASQDFTWTVLLANTGSGSILREWWLNISGSDLSNLTSNPAYPSSPTGSDQRTTFEAPSDWADNHGQRMRGFVVPPVSGPYRFWIAGDDAGQLILSTDDDPVNGSIIAHLPAPTPSRDWIQYQEQASAYITLQAGRRYYIEALAKEGTGSDSLAVAWQIPNSSGPAIIEGQYLVPWQDNRPPVLTNPGARTNVIANAVTLNVTATDADNDVLAFSAGGLPDGLGINPTTGVVTGAPTVAGTFNVTLSVTDGRSPAVTVAFVWTIQPPLELNAVAAAPPQALGATLAYTASSTGGANVRYQWSWGDGTPDTGFSSSASASHAYAAPGRYQITLSATDDTGRITTSTFYQAVHASLTALRPTASSSIAYEDRPDGTPDRLWCVNQDNNSISVFDTVSRARLAEIPVGAGPRTLALAPDGRVWVTNVESGTVSIISGSSLSVVQTITLPRGARPYGIAFDPDGTDGWIACEGTGELLRMNPATGTQVAALLIGSDARHVSVSADGARVFVTRFITPPLPGESTATITTGNTAGGEVFSVLTSSMIIEKKSMLLHSDRDDTITTGRGIPNYLGPAVISPDGLAAWVPSKQDNIKRGMLRDGQHLTHDQTIRSVASRIPLTDGSPAVTDDVANRVDFDNAGIASHAAFDPSGTYLFTALEGSREVGVVDVWNKREIRRFSAGRAPQGVAVSPDGRTVYVQNFMDRTITVHDVGAVIDGLDTVPTLTATLACITTERLSAPVLLGKQHFYDSADPRLAFQQYISCAACHNDGGHDGRVWDFTGFGEGLRNTISLRGHGGTAQGPVHWTGNFDEIQDFENQLRNLTHGTGLIAGGSPHPPLGTPNAGRSADLDSLAQFVSFLTGNASSPSRNGDRSLSASAQAGRQVFAEHGCATCHGGAAFTDSAVDRLHDVGTIKSTSGGRLGATLTGLDTPTLRGVWETAPYLHDGSAPTLEAAVLAHSNASRPGAGSQAMNDLVAYLKSIDDDELSPPLSLAVAAPLAIVGVPYADGTVSGNGGISPYNFSASGLPAGMTVHPTTGAITGMPTGPAGMFNVTFRITDSTGASAETVRPVSVDTAMSLAVSPVVAAVGEAVSGQVTVTGGTGPYRHEASGLPDGLTLNLTTGAITGATTTAGIFTVAYSVTDGMEQQKQLIQPFVTGSFSISGQVRDDADMDGSLADLDQPVPHVTVKLYADSNGNGGHDPSGDLLIGTTVTDALGAYQFTGVPEGTYFVEETDPVNAASTGDAQGANDNLVRVIVAGANGTRNDFLDAVDPSGYIYSPVNGQIIGGGSITVSGPGAVTVVMDGSTGQYSFVLPGPVVPGVYTITFTPPLGYKLDHQRQPESGPFNPPDGSGTVALGRGESPGNPGFLTDASAAANPSYLRFELAAGDRFVINNNFPVVPIVPSSYADWRYQHAAVGADGPLDNPKGGRYNNLLQFAFGLDSSTTVMTGSAPVELLQMADNTKPAGFRVDARVRQMPGLASVTYALEFISDLAASGAGWNVFAGGSTSSVNHPDGSVTVTYQDVESLTGLTTGAGFIRVKVTDSSAGATARTPASAWFRRTALQGVTQTASMPLISDAIFSGKVDAATSTLLQVATAAGAVSVRDAIIASGRPCYVEVTSGTRAGHRFEVDAVASTASAIALVASSPRNTLSPVPALAAGDRIELRPHRTLGELFPKASFTGSDDPATADKLNFFDAVNQRFESYWLMDVSGMKQWVAEGDAALADAGGRIVDAVEGLFVTARSASVSQVFTGVVRETPCAISLRAGSNLLGGGWPMAQSPSGRAMTLAAGFTGSNNPADADKIQLWKADSTGAGDGGYLPHYLLDYATYHQWTPQGNASLINDNDTVLFLPFRAAMLRSVRGMSGYVAPLPWSP